MYSVYDPSKWSFELDGMTVTAIAEGGVNWEKAEAKGEAKWGIQGDAIWQKTINTGYKLTVAIMRNCPQKAQIVRKYKSNDFMTVSASHPDLDETFSGTKAVFEEEPNFEGGTEAGDLELVFYVFDGDTDVK